MVRLPVHPWLLGYWLGDGVTSVPLLTVGFGDVGWLLPTIDDLGILWSIQASGDQRCVRISLLKQRPAFREARVLGNKHVPQIYITAGVFDRLWILRGLMDSDGSASKTGYCVFATTSASLKDGVYHLAKSLWERPKIYIKIDRRKGRTGQQYKDLYNVRWAPKHCNPFSMPRKADRVTKRFFGVPQLFCK